MKKLILPFSLALLGCAGFASNSEAQRYDKRVDVAEQARANSRTQAYGRDDREDRYEGREDDRRGGGSGRLRLEADRLRADVRRVREEMRLSGGGGRRMRARFDRVVRASEQISYEVRRGGNPWRVRRHIEETRSELYRLQRELRDGRHGPR